MKAELSAAWILNNFQGDPVPPSLCSPTQSSLPTKVPRNIAGFLASLGRSASRATAKLLIEPHQQQIDEGMRPLSRRVKAPGTTLSSMVSVLASPMAKRFGFSQHLLGVWTVLGTFCLLPYLRGMTQSHKLVTVRNNPRSPILGCPQ